MTLARITHLRPTVQADVREPTHVDLRNPLQRIGKVVARCETCWRAYDLSGRRWVVVEPCGDECPRKKEAAQ